MYKVYIHQSTKSKRVRLRRDTPDTPDTGVADGSSGTYTGKLVVYYKIYTSAHTHVYGIEHNSDMLVTWPFNVRVTCH